MNATDAAETARLRKIATEGVRAMIALTGDDPDRAGLEDTPRRVIDALIDMTDRPGDPAALLARVFGEGTGSGQMITVGPIPFDSVCEHHLLPFTGRAWVAYIPAGQDVVGLSKLPRLVDHFARRLQVQERLTEQIADAIATHLSPVGVGVKVTSTHSCMAVRGVRKPGAQMTTTALRGVLLTEPAARAEFLDAAR
ncbi:GTP cyclohydrolase I [Amycolatopsis thermophila]|uniref:GTP cyclohydrolase 1 n=1 Tax=Amycolatopsis thermophila TaxID=206084 RepID=A0ABU0ENY1_9PSEU|nr:GTP cyclohydrolase I [Amycolatopsis thermophila]MDQ0376507.1 GTP cyclohydrolase I [Amycolatopsis thermophila]